MASARPNWHIKPSELQVERHIQRSYVCPKCEGGIHTAPKPPSVIPKSMATASLLSGTECALMVDGYEGYNQVGGQVVRLGCWAHARRQFIRAQRQQPKGKRGGADQALAWIGQLYRLERRLKEQTQPRTAPTTSLGQAMGYLANQWSRLMRYAEDGRCSLDNNRAENAIRPFVIGGKNYLFSQSVRGVRANANLYSLIETAKAHGIEPHAYLLKVFEELPLVTTVEGFEGLLPDQFDNGAGTA